MAFLSTAFRRPARRQRRFNGVAKNSFLIKDGKLAGAVTETTISGNFAELLKNLRGISRGDGVRWLQCAALGGI